MSETETKRFAWQPFTPRGVAAFAESSFDRFQVVRLLVGLISSATVVVFLWIDWWPVVGNVLQLLPESAQIQNGQLTGLPAPVLAENHFLSVLFNLGDADDKGQAGDVQAAFGKLAFDLCALRGVVGEFSLGCSSHAYGNGDLSLAPSVMVPWWGAWRGMILAGIGLAVFLLLLLSWVLLGLIYALPVRLVAMVARRRVTWGGSWRLAGAALMPGAVFLSLGILAYGFSLIDLVRLVLIFGLHFVIGWFYVVAAPFELDKLARDPAAARVAVKLAGQKAGRNPFAGK
jgi:hypothetical protein